MKKEFDDIPAGTPLEFDHLVFYLRQGREIEFIYDGEEYFISNSKEGRALWKETIQLSDYFEIDDLEALSNIKIKNKNLADIFKNSEGIVQTVF
ncbi:hypothetical protein [Atopococcus tabaci]|uniref:hypothetical protein n=1 Tax=Atopococcus tabaci TaxID=269774 RepID=UPI000411D38A|nr:hypothetical protein [Atopococcus tabaci]